MADTNWGENMGSQLMAGFVQGRKIALEKKRLALAEKEQNQLNDFRLRQLAQAAAQQQQQQQQYEEEQAFKQRKLEQEDILTREKIKSNLELRKSYIQMVEARYGNSLAQDQREAVTQVSTDMTAAVIKVMTDPRLTPKQRDAALKKIIEGYKLSIDTLPLSNEEKVDLLATAEEVTKQEAQKEIAKKKGLLGNVKQYIMDAINQ